MGVGVRGWSGCKGKKCACRFVRFVNYLSNVTALYMMQGHTSLVPRPAPFSKNAEDLVSFLACMTSRVVG